jgi:predicted  nucleic acid-binding Zn-ribbon protein
MPKTEIQKKCKKCGTSFTTFNARAKFCNPKCKQNAYHKRKKAANLKIQKELALADKNQPIAEEVLIINEKEGANLTVAEKPLEYETSLQLSEIEPKANASTNQQNDMQEDPKIDHQENRPKHNRHAGSALERLYNERKARQQAKAYQDLGYWLGTL